jgi:drug/metabolite transporter (DMT)-like permease
LRWAVLVVAISGTFAAFLFYLGVKLVGASTASLLGNLEPVVSVLLAAAVLDESLAITQLAGGGLVVGSVVVLSLQARSRSGSEVSSVTTPP